MRSSNIAEKMVKESMKKFSADAAAAAKEVKEDKEVGSRLKSVSQAGTSLHGLTVRTLNLTSVANVAVAQGALDYAERSLKQYGATAEASAADDKEPK